MHPEAGFIGRQVVRVMEIRIRRDDNDGIDDDVWSGVRLSHETRVYDSRIVGFKCDREGGWDVGGVQAERVWHFRIACVCVG